MGFFRYLTSKTFLFTLIGIISITVLLLFGLGRWLNYYTHHDEKIEVPDLQKLSIDETEKILKDKNLFYAVIDSASFNPEYPPKSVIEQSPDAGSFVKQNRKIYLTLNPSNYRNVKLPSYTDEEGGGLPKRYIVSRLKSVGFKIGKIRYAPYKFKGVVRGYEIKGKPVEPGELLPKNTVIDLVLGDGFDKVLKDSIVQITPNE
jgi:beta-lactam-binding protein with PASTA domain